MDLPDWGQLLARLASDTEGVLPYAQLAEYTHEDYLQIAEYLYLKYDERIGPLRHIIERNFPRVSPITSAAHIELVNLGAPQIYTTNYDDLIESTFRLLGLPVNVVALPKDVALADSEKTQVVKYHGDLRHETTLVLTESSYYRRLDFESPMDLKFRSDLLGRSVLFMGYSFRDINIRVIWFKLMQMMKDIPSSDRRQSYIVRLEPNPVLEELYGAVGLRTIVLDPERKAKNDSDRKNLIGEFLMQLSTLASKSSEIPGKTDKMFASTALIEAARREAKREGLASGTFLPRRRNTALAQLGLRRMPTELREDAKSIYQQLLSKKPSSVSVAEAVAVSRLATVYGPSPELTAFFARCIPMGHIRGGILDDKPEALSWETIWSCKVDAQVANDVLKKLASEINYNVGVDEGPNADYDIAYAVDIAARIEQAQIIDQKSRQVRAKARELLEKATSIYPSVKAYTPSPTSAPSVKEIISEIDNRIKELDLNPDVDATFDDEPPF